MNTITSLIHPEAPSIILWAVGVSSLCLLRMRRIRHLSVHIGF